ncbi:MAG: glycoside hydrolase family 43 protein [Phycisphaerae bacterium]
MKFKNPILPGFYPDPSICRVGEDYFLVNSSFEYFPGVPLFHSRDMVNWRQVGHCLTRAKQLPLQQAEASGGIYAPTIRWHKGRFYMVTTNMTHGGNFYVYTDDPFGEWSDPVWVEQKGIDPSLLFDDDGKVYFTSNGTRWAPRRGIYQCEIDIATGRQLTETEFLWPGTGGSYPEAPHLFKRGDYYYLMIAEGGTETGHMVTIARSRHPFGPFEPCPNNPILTHRSTDNPLQCTGHADLVEDHCGNWWGVFLAVRYAQHGLHNIGRETCLAPVSWDAEGWPVFNRGQRVALESSGPDLPLFPQPASGVRDDFDAGTLGLCWNYLRNFDASCYSLSACPGRLTLRPNQHTLDEPASPAFAARRQQHIHCRAACLLEHVRLAPGEEAGLAAYMNPRHHAELAVACNRGRRELIFRQRIGPLVQENVRLLPSAAPIELQLVADDKYYTFSFREGGERRDMGRHEVRYLCTEVAGGYTGVYLGLYAARQKLHENAATGSASFDWFDYAGGDQG